jgi:hypothetical protein
MQILAGALILGAVMALAILTLVRSLNPPPPPDSPLISYMALGFALVGVAVSFVVPNVVAAGGRRRLASGPAAKEALHETGAWYPLYQTCMLLRFSQLEGVTFFLIVAWLLEGWEVTLIAAAVLIALMLLLFPTAERVERWAQTQRELASQDRPLS